MQEHHVIVDIVGIGFCVAVPQSQRYGIGQEVELIVYFHWNPDAGPQLFGFQAAFERSVFSLLLSCQGVGPKLALSVLTTLPPAAVLTALISADYKALSSVDGIGQKKAEQLCMSLKEKASRLLANEPLENMQDAASGHLAKVASVLSSLHYSKQEVSFALEQVRKESGSTPDTFDDSMRRALLALSRQTQRG